ncbi:exopolysaccharide biosynthesis polyprenyl glycosylphosphotransferase [Anaerocellum danielii]|uniref:Exopolysaccharide biosynthesis polyprenyl glycosylphosphotransferase n=1 Tax=Anaerocellum danielii TaxID=1387557 RepID=A0ABZ0U2P5_9FIRM|nr:exopolysaccharide biosynthesis polyprenyl glycosylphosphotransferase [Caldicellulosiruptor danielii]WPX08505.1 exopolysaccharide biosynthesis polyprenyl glycosylphosphotransferase [Caldicellulosiruptor danielii]
MPDELKIWRKLLYNLAGFIALTLAYFAAYRFRFDKIYFFEEKLYFLTYGLIVLFWLILVIKVSKELNLNKIGVKEIVLNTLKRAIAIFIYISCIDFVAKLGLSRIVIGTFILIYLLVGIVLKIILMKIEGILFKSLLKDYHFVIIGTKEAIELEREINLLDCYKKNSNITIIEVNPKNENSISYTIEGLYHLIKYSIVDEVVILLSEFELSTLFLKKVIEICKASGRRLKIIYRNELGVGKAQLSVDENNIIFDFKPVETSFAYVFVKRLLDIVISLIALMLTAPLFLLIAILIKLDSPGGPVFFVQERVGLNGRRFKLIKFRTMVPNAEELKEKLKQYNEMDGPVFKMTNDPRITRVGKILRKLNLDELPQLINVLKGEMSIVGPRPLETKEALGCEFEHHIRHSVKPGLTCIWQTTHNRNDVGYNEWMRMDYEYITKKNLLLDLYLIFKTFLAIIKLNGK